MTSEPPSITGGEDVYDLAVWCRWCDAPHADCEPFDEENTCIICGALIPEGDWCDEHC
jgi:hypothetical protein